MLTTLLLAAAMTQELPPLPTESDPDVWVTEGAAIPWIELPRIDGGAPFDLGSLAGKKVLLIQFASW